MLSTPTGPCAFIWLYWGPVPAVFVSTLTVLDPCHFLTTIQMKPAAPSQPGCEHEAQWENGISWEARSSSHNCWWRRGKGLSEELRGDLPMSHTWRLAPAPVLATAGFVSCFLLLPHVSDTQNCVCGWVLDQWVGVVLFKSTGIKLFNAFVMLGNSSVALTALQFQLRLFLLVSLQCKWKSS